MSWWNTYVGIPFRDGGRDRDGCDCAGLVCLVYKEQFEKEIDHDFGFYDATDSIQASALIGEASQEWEHVFDPKDGDVVLLNVYGEPCHVGIVVDDAKSVLNVRERVRAVIEPLDRAPWKTRIHSYWRHHE